MDWIIGDVHGMAVNLDRLIKRIEKQDSEATFWFVGDYCDRGPDSRGVVDRIIGLGDRARPIRGNHDEAFDAVLNGPNPDSLVQGEDAKVQTLQMFMNYGMVTTLNSYGISNEQIVNTDFNDAGVEKLTASIPQSHRDFYRNLPLWRETKEFFIVHALVNTQLEKSLTEYFDVVEFRQAALWQRFDRYQIDVPKPWPKIGYFGHTPVSYYNERTPIKGPQIMLLDTGAFETDLLSAVCHQTGQIICQ